MTRPIQAISSCRSGSAGPALADGGDDDGNRQPGVFFGIRVGAADAETAEQAKLAFFAMYLKKS